MRKATKLRKRTELRVSGVLRGRCRHREGKLGRKALICLSSVDDQFLSAVPTEVPSRLRGLAGRLKLPRLRTRTNTSFLRTVLLAGN